MTQSSEGAEVAHDGAQAEPQERPVAGDGVARIAAERQRQIEEEGWTPEHDVRHVAKALLFAATAYVSQASDAIGYEGPQLRPEAPAIWPWAERWWKPSPDPIRNLEKAGALIAAEIDRLLRARSGGEA